MIRHRRPRRRRLRGVLALTVAALLAAFFMPQHADAATPSEDACHTVNNSAPLGDCGVFKQVYRDNFNPGGVAATASVGTFSGCGGDGDYRCAGAYGTRYYNTLGAYPDGWTDTAGHHGDGNYGPVPGDYRPSRAASVIRSSTGDGQLKVHMSYSATTGRNTVAAMVPLKCMNLHYGKFTERTRITVRNRRFKMAHLRYSNAELDFPEAGSNFGSDPIYAYAHGFADQDVYVAPNSAWTSWHTYSQEIVPGKVRLYFDGKLIETIYGDYPDATPEVLQNESALGDVSVTGAPSSTDVLTTWLTCYRYGG